MIEYLLKGENNMYENNRYNNYGSTYETFEESFESLRTPNIITLKNKKLFNLFKQQFLDGDVIATINIDKTTIYLLSIKDEKKQTEKITGFNATTHKLYDIASLDDLLNIINEMNQNKDEEAKTNSKEIQKKK